MPPGNGTVTTDAGDQNDLEARRVGEENLNVRRPEQNNLNALAEPLLPKQISNGGSKEHSGKAVSKATDSGKTRAGGLNFSNIFRSVYPKTHASTPKPFLPATQRAPLLLTVAAGCIVLLVLLEVLSHKNARDGAIMFASNGQSLSSGQEFTYLYLPTIIAVIGSMIWSWIDLDVKRLESFFQLSKPGGASGSDSVLLSYPVDFLALVPITATRRRHYTVMAAGVVMCLIFWVITPLQVSFRQYLRLSRCLDTG